MPKVVKAGVGMMEHTRVQYDLSSAGGEAEWQASIDHIMKSFVGVDDKREQLATNFRTVLQRAGVFDPNSVLALNDISNRYSSDTLEYLMAKWLMQYDYINIERAAVLDSPDQNKLQHLV